MDSSNHFQPFFFNFFLRLKKDAGIELDIRQYEAFLSCWLTEEKMSKAELLYLCETTWLTRKEFRGTFERLFEEYYALFERTSAEKKQEKSSEGANSDDLEKIPDREKKKESPTPSSSGSTPTDSGGKQPPVDLGEKQDGPTPEAKQPGENTKNWPEVSLTIKDTSNGKGSGSDSTSPSPGPSTFIFLSEKALPFPVRKTTQMWRKVATRFTEQPTNRLDIPALIQQRIQDGMVHRLVYETEKVENQQIVWLSDHEGSMNPFAAWEDSLLRAVTNTSPAVAGRLYLPNFDRYFFHDHPMVNDSNDDFQLFANRSHTEAIDWRAARQKQKWDKHTLVIIYSDGAAAHRKLDFERVKAFYEISRIIRLTTPRLLWINPVQQTDQTSAQYIAYFVEMVYPDEPAFARFTTGLPPLPGAETDRLAWLSDNQAEEKKLPWPQPEFATADLDSMTDIRLEAFQEVCPESAYWWLACHAAFPVALTTDLLQQIWLNFQTDESGNPYQSIPLSAVDEVIHSPLLREIGRDLYEIYPEVREVLLQSLRDQWGENREWRLANFMKAYLAERRDQVPTATLAAAEKINYKTRTMSPSELTKEINSLLKISQDKRNSQRMEVLTQIEYMLSIARRRSKNQKPDQLADPLQVLQKLTDGIQLARKEDGAAAREAFQEALPFLEESQKESGGYKVKLPPEVQEKLLRTTVDQSVPKSEAKPALFALLVGINDYQQAPKLSGCLNDVIAMEKYLQSRSDFEVHTQTLTNGQATRRGIIDGFRFHLSQATAADTVLFYFAGHGALEEANDVWKKSTSECLVCHDYSGKRPADYLIADKEFQYLVYELYQKTNAHIVTLGDCGYPAENTRSGALIAASYAQVHERGTLAADGRPFPQRKWDDFLFSNAIPSSSVKGQSPDQFLPRGRHVHIEASEANQLAVEIDSQGVFTKTLVKTLTDYGGDITYRTLMGHLRQYMRASFEQTPKIFIQDDLADTLLDSGFLKRTIDPNRMICEAIHGYNGWQLNSGAIHGLKPDSQVVLVDPTTPDKLYRATIRPGEIFIDYALIDVEGLDSSIIYKAEISGMTSQEFRLELRNHDGNPREIQKVVDALQKASVYCSFSESAEAHYTLHFRSGEAYFTYPNDPYRPLIRPIEFMNSDSHDLMDAFQHISRWHFIRHLQNEEKPLNFPVQPLKIELTRILADGNTEEVKISGDSARLEYEKIGDDWRGNIHIKITNTTTQNLYVCVAYLANNFFCFLDFLPQRMQLLEAGKSVFLGFRGGDRIALELGKVETEYNWPLRQENLKFLVSTKEFKVDALALDELPDPLTLSEREAQSGYDRKSGSRGLATDKISLFFSDWFIQTLLLEFKNPLYNQVPIETVQALVEWEETSYFATGIYKAILNKIPEPEGGKLVPPSGREIEVSTYSENEPKGLFNGMSIALANQIETLQRRRRYKQLKKDPSRLRIVAVGDSWFQYPFLLKDVVEHLYKNYAICCLAKAGNKLENYQKKKDYLDTIGEEDAHFMLICPGLNNLLLVELPSLLKSVPDPADTTPKRYLNQKFFEILINISNQMDAMLTELLGRYPDLNILVHCYDYFIPIDSNDPVNRNKSSWCGRHMINKKITSQIERENLMRYIIDALTETLSELVHREKFQNKVTLVDTRGLVFRNEWYDELHPTSEGFRKIADAFIKEIERIRYQENQSFTSNA